MRPHPDTGCYKGHISLSNILTTSNTVRCLHPRCKIGSHPLMLGWLHLWSANSHLRMSSLLVARQGVHRHNSQDRDPRELHNHRSMFDHVHLPLLKRPYCHLKQGQLHLIHKHQ